MSRILATLRILLGLDDRKRSDEVPMPGLMAAIAFGEAAIAAEWERAMKAGRKP